MVLGFEGARPTTLSRSTGGWARELYTSGEFTGKPCELAILHRPAGLKAKRLVLAGAGKRDKFDANEMRKAVGAAVRIVERQVAATHLAYGWNSRASAQCCRGGSDPWRFRAGSTEDRPEKRREAAGIVHAGGAWR